MSTLAEQFHDSFDAYYSGKNSGWAAEKAAQRRQASARQEPDQMQQAEAVRDERIRTPATNLISH